MPGKVNPVIPEVVNQIAFNIVSILDLYAMTEPAKTYSVAI
jgi:aspartate ammonia-lyase